MLSAYRAFAVKDYILGNSPLEAGKIRATGCGEYNPIADNSTPEGRARNRRVEMLITKSDTVERSLEEYYAEMNRPAQ